MYLVETPQDFVLDSRGTTSYRVGMPLTDERKREYQRLYKRAKRDPTVQEAAKYVRGILSPRPGGARRLNPDRVDEAARAALALALQSHDLGLNRVLQALSAGLAAERPYNAVKGQRRVREVETVSVPDNESRLRAVEQAIRLHQHAGTIPASLPIDGPEAVRGPIVAIQFAQAESAASSGSPSSTSGLVFDAAGERH